MATGLWRALLQLFFRGGGAYRSFPHCDRDAYRVALTPLNPFLGKDLEASPAAPSATPDQRSSWSWSSLT